MELTEFWTLCSSNGIVLTKKQLDDFTRFITELLYWNKNVNLISRKDEENIIVNHILHSLTALKYIELPNKARCLDVGTGGGLPGIPITIANPSIHMLMVDSIAKKAKIADMLAKHTGIRTISAITARAEELRMKKEYLNHFDFIFSRAVARIDKVYSWVQGLLKPGGKLVLYKGGDCTEEIEAAKSRYPELKIEEIPIKFMGIDWFEANEKKIIICTEK
jgi:16S rRNA (guanine527-N7)-methyltransferase